MKPFALWKTATLWVAILVGALYALPNFYSDDPAVQISRTDGTAAGPEMEQRITATLAAAELVPESIRAEGAQWVVRFDSTDDQLEAADVLRPELGRDYAVALNLATRTPGWLQDIGARPMNLGLDLRGGVHFLLEVDVADARTRALDRYLNDVPAHLRSEGIRYTGRRQADGTVVIEFADDERRSAARRAIASEFDELALNLPDGTPLRIEARLTDSENARLLDFAVRQNLTTLRNRVNQLGVAEPLVQRQGENRIVVQLPGVQDTTRVKELLGATATLEYRAVDEDNDPRQAAATGVVPFGSELFYTRDGRPVLLKRDIIATGDQLTNAQATIDQESGTPAVSVTLDGAGARRMFEFTQRNVGRPMAVVYKESEVITTYNARGEPIRERNQIEEVISIATIRGVFGKRFQTTGLATQEAQNLALLLRAGALAAPIDIVEERTVGPSLGADNIRQGQMAALIGLIAVLIFMGIYYRQFGLIANVALVINLMLLIAIMSMIQATLTMPGIAGIVLTLGMAVDANVLIYERIREELAAGTPPAQAADAGYDRALLTIADSQVTTLIAAVVLFALGSGPVKGFAVTLSIGIATSMFTALIGTRALVYFFYGRKGRLTDLPV
jgi:preprotein translocase subunit SecD